MTEIPPGDEFYFQWHITEKCNQRCTHCYHESYESTGELDPNDLEAVFREMERALHSWGRTGSFSLTGGEPFMRRVELFDTMTLLDRSDAVGYYDILTNGSLITNDDITALTDAAKLRRIQLSLESHLPEENDRVRGGGSHHKIVECIRRLKKANLQVSVMTTITRRNMDSVPDMIEFLADHAVDSFAIERFIPEGSGEQMRDLMLSTDEARALYETVHRLGIAERRIRVLMYRPLFALVDSTDPTVGAMCSVGNNALTIMHDGTVLPCRRLPIRLGHVLDDGLFKIWYDSDLLWHVREKSNIEGCGQCELLGICRGCRAMAHYVSGDHLACDPHCWRDDRCIA